MDADVLPGLSDVMITEDLLRMTRIDAKSFAERGRYSRPYGFPVGFASIRVIRGSLPAALFAIRSPAVATAARDLSRD
jgi:hypothetical protein